MNLKVVSEEHDGRCYEGQKAWEEHRAVVACVRIGSYDVLIGCKSRQVKGRNEG